MKRRARDDIDDLLDFTALNAARSGAERSSASREARSGSKPYVACRLCGRNCAVNRASGAKGVCGMTERLRIASAVIHKGEEPPIIGQGGSGAIFFSGCALHCAFCQNHQISHKNMGNDVDEEDFINICFALKEAGAENINLVTGGHFAPSIASGLRGALSAGLDLPAVWNSSAYEKAETIDLIAPYVTVYLPDLKTLSADNAGRWFGAWNYPEVATKAILRMAQAAPLRYKRARCFDTQTTASGEASQVLASGLIFRHLVMPGQLEDTRAVLRWYADHLADRALLSLMTQYTPIPSLAKAIATAKAPKRYLEEAEHDAVLNMLEEFDIDNGFYQELVLSDAWLPDFDRKNPFSSELSRPIWHWRDGFIKA